MMKQNIQEYLQKHPSFEIICPSWLHAPNLVWYVVNETAWRESFMSKNANNNVHVNKYMQ